MLRHLSLAALCTGLPLLAAAADVTLAGSDLLRPALEKPLAGLSVGAGRTVRLRLDGSRGALDSVRAGRADLAVVTFAPDEPLPDKEFRLIPLAYQVVVFAVIDSNPVRQLSYAQLGGIFGDKEPLSIRQWGGLGATGVWAEKSIALNMVDAPDSLAHDLFLHTVLTNPVLRSTIMEQTSSDELLRKVRVDDTCIGMFPRLPGDTEGVHVLMLSRDTKDVPFGPTPENINTGDYPLRLPFFIAFDPSRAAELAPAVAALLGDDAAAALEKAGFVAVPANARSATRSALGAK
jgi:phosphate transport system substrate-binding protein